MLIGWWKKQIVDIKLLAVVNSLKIVKIILNNYSILITVFSNLQKAQIIIEKISFYEKSIYLKNLIYQKV